MRLLVSAIAALVVALIASLTALTLASWQHSIVAVGVGLTAGAIFYAVDSITENKEP